MTRRAPPRTILKPPKPTNHVPEAPAGDEGLMVAYHSPMPLTCNIDAKGKLARLIYGLVMIGISVLVAVLWAWPRGGGLPWAVVGILFACGAFGVFEARAGWCVMRAMGFKTKI